MVRAFHQRLTTRGHIPLAYGMSYDRNHQPFRSGHIEINHIRYDIETSTYRTPTSWTWTLFGARLDKFFICANLPTALYQKIIFPAREAFMPKYPVRETGACVAISANYERRGS
jgi:hypothetical protein